MLLPNKSKKTYLHAFKTIAEKEPLFNPPHIISDFEIGAINALREIFVAAQTHGCFFHLCKSVWAKIQNVGLKERYSNDAEFALNMRQLTALAFVPVQDIQTAFEKLCDSDFWSPESEDEDVVKIQEVLSYFETTYIGVPTRTQARRRKPIFEPKLWSVYELIKSG